MESVQPQCEHLWLHKLVGNWNYESQCSMGPDQPLMTTIGKETVRSLGGLWTLGDGEGTYPGGTATTMMTLGFDPTTKRFTGTFVASMMTHLWLYDGSLDEAKTTLTLEAEGPSMTKSGTAKYRDIIEFVDDDHRKFTARILGADGVWVEFMTALYTRIK